jgi:ABC-type polysaccharide/polyol phosphate transport system ATPase subunit
MPVKRDEKAVAIEVRGLSKSFRIATRQPDTFKERIVHPFRAGEYKELEVLRKISFDVYRGEFFGIVGRNGSGKSTLLKLLASIYRADRGRIRVAGTIHPIIELGVGFHPEMSARDNVITNGLMLGLTAAEAQRRFDAVIEFAELEDFVDLKLKNYSSGMRARLAFAIAIQVEPDILLLDEVLAVGDPPFAQRCQETFEDLKRRGKSTVVLVTHAVPNLERHCDRAMMVEEGSIDLLGSPRDVGARYSGLRAAPFQHPKKRAPVKIVRIGAIDGEGGWTNTVEPGIGMPLRLRVVIDADEPLESARLRLWLTNRIGIKVFAPPPIPLEGEAELLDRGEQVAVSVQIENRLAPGPYNAYALVSSGEGIFTASSEIASSGFQITAVGRPEEGLVSLEYEIETEAAGAGATKPSAKRPRAKTR